MARASKKPTDSTSKAFKLGLEKLRSSGLDLDDAKKLHLEFLLPDQTIRLHKSFKPLCALKLNYLAADGSPLSDWPKAPPFYRLRYLEQATDFEALTEKKQIRYVQEPNSAPTAYLPGNQVWGDLLENTYEPLVLTEGELKAAKACKEGFPTIGLGGVYNWRSMKLGITFLPILETIAWVKRHVYLCFDSDFRTNPMVCGALRDLSDELTRRGAYVYVVCLPQLPDLEKVGLDDYLVHAGPAAPDMFRRLLEAAEPFGLARPLFSYNDQYVYVRDPGVIIDQGTMFKTSPDAFKNHLESTTSYQERVISSSGDIRYQAGSAAKAWLSWPLRTEVAKLTYMPGKERFVDAKFKMFNTWNGWGVEAKKGDVKPFLQLVDHLFTGAEPAAKQWFLAWCAYPLINPGMKLFSSVVLHGIRHGTGKSLVGYTLGRIYGENFTEINQLDLHNNHNEWAEGKQLVLGDDVTGSNKRQDADFLKKLITQREIRINPKFIRSYTVPDCINYYFTANHPDSFFLEDDDRRFFIHEVQVGPLDNDFYREYDLWLDTGGSAAVFHYLLNLDVGDFNPAAPAFRTSAKERMIANVQSDLAGWVRQLLATPDVVLRLGEITLDKDLLTSKELLQFYDPEGRTGTTANGLGRELARAGVRQVCDGKPVRLPDGTQGRYYVIRNVDYWARQGGQSSVVKYLTDWNKDPKKGAKRSKKY